MKSWVSAGVEETRRIGEELAAALRPDGCLLLHADLGSGKTVLAQGVAKGLGIDPAEVQSPTYTLLREHAAGSERLLHFDLYRLAPHEVEAAGFEELLLGPGVKVVEWAERLPFDVPGALRLAMRATGPQRREIRETDRPTAG
jgi:tRNA threonylcarbamoyladenosine biosynthesis protein TsaE